MYNQQYKKALRKKRNHRAGRKTRASRAASHLRWLHRRALKSNPRIKIIEEVSFTPETIARLKSSVTNKFHFETSAKNPETEHCINSEPSQPFLVDHQTPGTSQEDNKTETIVKPPTLDNLTSIPINSSESFPELDQNINFPRENVINHENSLPIDLISQLRIQLPENYFIIDEYASYLNF